MQLNVLTETELLKRAKTLVDEERRITLELLAYLREIEKRALYSNLGYSSFYEFVVKELGLSEGAAHRRISAMRLMKDVPQAHDSLESGKLSLSNAAKIHVAFRQVRKIRKLTPEKKAEIVEACAGLSQKECEVRLFQLLPETAEEASRERVRFINENQVEVKMVIDRELFKKVQLLNGFFSHINPECRVKELFEYLVKTEFVRQEKKRGLSTVTVRKPRNVPENYKTPQRGFRKAVSAEKVREVWKRAGAQCEFQGCTSRFQLQIDHKTPLSRGGGSEIENLRLLCRTHNLGEANRILGARVMSRYTTSLGS